ncbi:MAG: hypothetical protein WBB29_09125 [Geitlerinemataceae cyanobacterium]
MRQKANRNRKNAATKSRQFRKSAARSNQLLNSQIKQHGGIAIVHNGKRINTYATVADMNNIAIKGKMAQVIQATESVNQTRDSYSDFELAQIEFLEMLEARVLEQRNPHGHAEIVCAIDEAIADVDGLLKKYSD